VKSAKLWLDVAYIIVMATVAVYLTCRRDSGETFDEGGAR
jgi:hypothetical protein